MAKFCDLNVPLPANGDCYHCFVILPDLNVFVVLTNHFIKTVTCMPVPHGTSQYVFLKSKITFWIA